jgi:hypothetical protein
MMMITDRDDIGVAESAEEPLTFDVSDDAWSVLPPLSADKPLL